MKTYDFDPIEFAKLEFLLAHAVSFLHQERSKAELDQFRAKFFPIVHDAYYQVLGSKIDGRQYEAISESDPWAPELPPERVIELLAEIFKA
ncbi:hypothetical protein NKJ87_10215 [Mesorhizobium sp. M0027]|nr:hypothetical protein X759_19620 [Mesorhizobium sp. LSHC420B00]